MSNAFCIVWRIPCLGSRASTSLQRSPATTISSLCSIQCGLRTPSISRRYSSSRGILSGLNSVNIWTRYPSAFRRSPAVPFFQIRRFLFDKYTYELDPPIYKPVPVRSKPFSKTEVDTIFGRGRISAALGNELLSHLHGRRVAGTPDVDLPVEIFASVSKSTADTGLKWLQEKYPIDEEAAILARIEAEEQKLQEKLVKRAEELGLYKPQSGSYDSEVGEGGDVQGKSVLTQFRQQNEARLLAEKERKRKQWLEGEHEDRQKLAELRRAVQNNTALQKFNDSAIVDARPRADPNERPLLAWIQKHHLEATNNRADVFESMTTARRIIPSLIVALSVIGLCYIFARYYTPPAMQDRLWPNTPPAAATIMGVIGANVAIFVLWRFPPAWKMLNRYFISSAGYPYALGILGNVFSHQSAKHLITNMLILWFMGTRLHDEVGRGNFLDVYLTSGVVGSMASLTVHVLRGKLATTALGASGALAGVVGAWLTMHANDKITIAFLPREWQDMISMSGWFFLANLVAFEMVGMLFPLRAIRLDHWAHLGGYFAGTVWALARKRKQLEEGRVRPFSRHH